MRPLDWAVLVAFLVYVVWDGARRGKKAKDIEGYFLAGRQMPWWAMGLSVMATQASAVTLLSTTGHGYRYGLEWLHVYLALPFAMVILCTTVVPWFTRARVFTAYEYLERRFDGPTRTIAAVMYLISRGLAVGVVLFAPSVVLSLILGIDQVTAIVAMGVLCVAYTMSGGIAAVIFTDVKQMTVMVIGIIACIVIVIGRLPEDVSLGDAVAVAGAANKMEGFIIPDTFEEVLRKKYNVISALCGGLFLFLGYFGADQSQVQRYLTGKSTRDSGRSLMMSAFAKVPMQFGILMLGALLFVFYAFEPPPLLFGEEELDRVVAELPEGERQALETRREDLNQRLEGVLDRRRLAAHEFLEARRAGGEVADAAEHLREVDQEVNALQGQGVELLTTGIELRDNTTDATWNDTDYIFPRFMMTVLPVGLLGLMMAAVFAAAMSSIDSVLSSLATSSVMDFYARFRTGPPDQKKMLRVSRIATLGWGVFAIVSALFLGNLGPVIEVVNRIGSFVYGSLFGVFFLGWVVPKARGSAGWQSLLGGFACVLAVHFFVNEGGDNPRVGFLWYNLIGFLGVMLFGLVLGQLRRTKGSPSTV